MRPDDHPINQLAERGSRRGARTMAADVTRSLRARRRNRMLVTVAGALLVIAGIGIVALRSGGDTANDLDTLDTPTPSTTTSTTTPTTSTTSTTTSTTEPAQTEFSGDGSAEDVIAGPLAAWNADPIGDYYLLIEPHCFCSIRPYYAEVTAGVAVATINEDGSPSPALTDEGLSTPTTVEQLFHLLRSYPDGWLELTPGVQGSTYAFTLDQSGRWPTHISLDPVINAIDDELALDITLLTERPAIFGTETVEVLILTSRILPGTPVEHVLDAVEETRVPAAVRPESALSREDLRHLGGWVTQTDIALNQIIVREQFVDPAVLTSGIDIPDGFVAFSVLYEHADLFEVGDAVVVTTQSETVSATVLALGSNPGIVTLLVANTEAQPLASADVETLSIDPVP